jgi:formamidopyrimidine-DNA glycosylase
MPELPEVETMRRGILGVIGSRISRLAQIRSRLQPIIMRPSLPALRRRVVGRRISDVHRVGKRVVLKLENQDGLVFEPRMTGLVLLADPPDQTHLRLQLDLEGGPVRQLWFWDRRGLGQVHLLTAGELSAQLGPDRLGPDALILQPGELRRRLAHTRRPIKVALLDQRIVAGIGNLYASEILHVARIDPRSTCRALTASQWQRLHSAVTKVLQEAIRYEGSTLSDGTYRNVLNNPGGYQNHHRVYARAGQDCPRCRREKVQRIVQAQRSTFFCPGCQKHR